MNNLIIDDLVFKQKIDNPDGDLVDLTDYKMVTFEIVKQTETEIHISTLWRKANDSKS